MDSLIMKSTNEQDSIKLEQLRDVKPSLVSFRTIRYSKKEMMQNISLDFYPNYRTTTSNYTNSLGENHF